MSDELLAIADELYALPLSDFTPARDAKAKELKGTDLAKPVKALKKPSVAAWVVNLLVRREAEQVEQVIAVGEALREAQAGMSADELRALTRQRRQLTAAVTSQARSLAREEGLKVTEAVADQVEATLTAAMVEEACGQALRSGLLVSSMASTGVDETDAAAAVALPEALGFQAAARTAAEPGPPDLQVVPDPDRVEKARAAAQEELDDAEAAVTEAQAELDEAAAAVEELRAKQLEIEAQVDELKRKIADLENTYDEVDDELGDAEDARSEAQDALTEAQESRDTARKALDELG